MLRVEACSSIAGSTDRVGSTLFCASAVPAGRVSCAVSVTKTGGGHGANQKSTRDPHCLAVERSPAQIAPRLQQPKFGRVEEGDKRLVSDRRPRHAAPQMRRQDRCRVAEGLFELRRQEVPHIVQPRAGEIGLGKIGAGEIGIIEHGTAQICAGEIGVRQSRMREIGARQISALEIGAGERGEAQRRAAEIGAPQDSAAEVGMIERGAFAASLR